MRKTAAFCAAAALFSSAASQRCEPWRTGYPPEHRAAAHVLAHWSFDGDAPLRDHSGHGHDLTLYGATLRADGRHGGGLGSAPGWPVADERHAAVARTAGGLSPRAAFSLELWLRPDARLDECEQVFLLDKKYVGDDDYQLVLDVPAEGGKRRLRAALGFGSSSETYHSAALSWPAATWQHVALTYDGSGTVRFFRNGIPVGGGHRSGRGSISRGRHPVSIGDRIGSYYRGFPGVIDEVRLCDGVREYRPVRIDSVGQRQHFVRMETGAALRLRVINTTAAPLRGAVLAVEPTPGVALPPVALPVLPADGAHTLTLPLDTTLRPGAYTLRAHLTTADHQPLEQHVHWQLLARTPPRMPVVLWGLGGVEQVERELDRVAGLGFTHCLGLGADYGALWNDPGRTAYDGERLAASHALLDRALARGVSLIVPLTPGAWAARRPELRRVDRHGDPHDDAGACALQPRLLEFCRQVGAAVARTWGAFPALDGALLHTEVRDAAQPCFHALDREAYRRATGAEIPPGVEDKRGIAAEGDRPSTAVVELDDPLLRYYRWYWQAGDGWNGLNRALHDGLRSTAPRLWTFTDPAARVASVFGSGGGVDVLSHWSYSYPDPIRVGMATESLRCMAAGAEHGPAVMKMVQLIWYRSQTAPANGLRSSEPPPRWKDHDPDASYLTIAPMHLREAVWTALARPVRGLMFHGWEALVPVDGSRPYRHTHPETAPELHRLVTTLVRPLGPALLQIEDAPTDVAFLESFSAQMLAGRGAFGWGTRWSGDSFLAASYAGLQPEIVYEDTILERGLDRYRVLLATDCDVLPRPVVDRIRAFQARGGILVADDRLCAALSADVTLPVTRRTGHGQRDKQTLQETAAGLADALRDRYPRSLSSSNDDVVLLRRRFGTTDYVFAINDAREYGDYVGQYEMVMERALPADTELWLAGGGTVYDLVRSEPIAPLERRAGGSTFALGLPPGGGRLLMRTSTPIDDVTIAAPARARAGTAVHCDINVRTADGSPIDAVIPVHVDIRDADGRGAEFSGHYGVSPRGLRLQLDLATNDGRGVWTIEVRELASGRRARHSMRVLPPAPRR